MAKKEGNWFSRHKILTVLGVILLIGIVGGMAGQGGKSDPAKVADASNNTSTNKAKEKTSFGVNETIAFDDKKVTVTSVERNWSSGNEYIKPETGKEYIKVQVSIENDSKSEASYNTFDWKLQDSAGVIKDVDSVAFGVDGALSSGQLSPGGKVSGFLVFQAPLNDTGLTLRYNPSFWSDKKVEIKI